jgi:hypothetical protein
MKTVHVLVGILICGLLVQGAFAQNRAKPMTNDDVISMVKAGLPENIVISAIGAQETNFDNSAPALVQLTKEGVSTRIITIMLAASKRQPSSPPSGVDPTSAPSIPSAGPADAQQSQSQPVPSQSAPIPQDSNQAKGDNKADSSSKRGGGGFFDKLNRAQNQVQNQVNGAAQQTQTSVQQGQATAKQAQGAASQVQSAVAGQGPSATPATTNPTSGTAPIPAPGSASIAAQARQAQQQQLVAERQKITEQMNACKVQATQIDPQMRTPQARTAYTSCVQSVLQAAAQAKKQAK